VRFGRKKDHGAAHGYQTITVVQLDIENERGGWPVFILVCQLAEFEVELCVDGKVGTLTGEGRGMLPTLYEA
jgi:hypothetical protein